MIPKLLQFFTVLRHIFGLCPKCGQLFRLSDAAIYVKAPPSKDWMNRLEAQKRRLERQEDSLADQTGTLREEARRKGRRLAQKAIRKIDNVFRPLRLNSDDAKVIFHPLDFIVFNGMKSPKQMKNIVLLDRETRDSAHRGLQRSLKQVIERGRYDWQTLRIEEDGTIKRE